MMIKKLSLLLVFVIWTLFCNSQVAKIIHINTAGELTKLLTPTEKSSITNLTITGVIDVRDFRCMRDELNKLAALDITSVSIAAYQGTEGTHTSTNYLANEIPQYAFFNRSTYEGKSSLKKIFLPLHIISIGDFSFNRCSNLELATIPNEVEVVKDYAFNSCSKISFVNIPASVTSIAKYAFSGCSSLTKFTVDPSNNSYTDIQGVLFNKEQTILLKHPEGRNGEFVIPNTVVTIANYAFSQSVGLKNVVIPSSVKSIETQAFYNCTSLNAIYANASTPIPLKASTNVFFNVNKDACTLHVPNGTAEMYRESPQWSDFNSILDNKATQVLAGGLSNALEAEDMSSITKLTLCGTIDARDFKTMRDAMPELAIVDLSGVSILGYDGNNGTLSTSFSYLPNSIPPEAFCKGSNGKTSIVAVILSNSVNVIGRRAFMNCINCTSIKMSNTLRSLEEEAMSGCKSLNSINFPATLNYIGRNALNGCSNVTAFNVDSENSMFTSDNGILYNKAQTILIKYPQAKQGSFDIPEGVTKLESYSIDGCPKLVSISIAKSIENIEKSAINYCPNLVDISVRAGNNYYASKDGVLFSLNPYSLIKYPESKIGNYTIPEQVLRIEDNAFNGSENLLSVNIPKSVTSIGSQAFYNCHELALIVAQSNTPVSLRNSQNVFNNVNKNTCNIQVPAGSIELYKKAFQWDEFSNFVDGLTVNVTVAGTLKEQIRDEEKAELTKLTVVGRIDARDFKFIRDELPKLSILDISEASIKSYTGDGGTVNSITTYQAFEIPQYAFFDGKEGMSNLKIVQLHDSTTSVGTYAFSKCVGINKFMIGPRVTSIKLHAFAGCTNLIEFEIKTNNQTYHVKDGVLFSKNCRNLILFPQGKIANYSIPDSVNSISDFAFEGASKLTGIRFTKNVRSIGEHAFSNCNKLNTVAIPKTVNSIGSFAFEKCRKLSKIAVDNDNSFYSSSDGVLLNKNKTNLIQFPAGKDGNYQIPDSVITISDLAFADCVELTGIVIPKSVKSIGNQAFMNCLSLNSIYIGSNLPLNLNPHANIFQHIDKTKCFVNVPVGSTTLYKSAPVWQEFTNINDVRKFTVKAGGLQTLCSQEEFANISKLTLIGVMDARDFKILRDLMPKLESVDLSGVKIISYDGSQGTMQGHANYPSNSIPAYAFYNGNSNNNSLKHIVLPNTLIGIGNYAFSHCNLLENVNMPKLLTNIGANAFSECNALTDFNIPRNTSSIGNMAFSKCRNLVNLSVDEENTHFVFKEGILFNKNLTQLIANLMNASKVYVVPDGVVKIEEYAFAECNHLTSVTFPKSVSFIGIHSFQNCENLSEIIVLSASPPGMGADVFFNINKASVVLQVPVGSDRNYKNAYQWKEFTHLSDEKKICIQAGELKNVLTTYEQQAVTKLVVSGRIDARDVKLIRDNMPNIITLDLSNATLIAYHGDSGTVSGSQYYPANTFPKNAFYNGQDGKFNVCNVYLPSSTEEIADFAFAQCVNLQKVYFPSSLSIIGNSSFYNCSRINNIILPKSLSIIGDNAFRRCASVTTISIPVKTSIIGKRAFSECLGLEKIILNDGLKRIKYQAFYGCRKLDSISIPSSVERIEEQAFVHCTSLSCIHVDDTNLNYSTIDGVLYNKSKSVLIYYPSAKKSELHLAKSVTEISDFAFFMAVGLSKVTMPNSLTRIGHCAFLGCRSLQTITIPSSVTTIGIQAFAKCRALSSIYAYPQAPILFGLTDNIFSGVSKSDCKLYVATGAVEAYQSASLWKEFVNVADGRIINIIPGTLATSLTSEELITLSKLTVTGAMDARDFRCLRDSMPHLSSVNLSGVAIKSYIGEGGTFTSSASYPANEIPQYAFDNGVSGKSNLKNIILPTTATTIGNNAFSGSAISSIYIPQSINLIRTNAFLNCILLESISVDPKNNNFSSNNGVLFNKNQTNIIFYPAAKAGAYVIPEKVITFEKNAFVGCKELTTIYIPRTLMAIRNGAFDGCTKLASYEVHPENLKYASQDGVLFNKTITALVDFPKSRTGAYTIPNSIVSVMNNAFATCVGITSVVIPYTVNNIGTNVFKSCVSLTNIIVEKENSNYASLNGVLYNKEMTTLLDCPKAKDGNLTIADSVQFIGDNAFSDCVKLSSITLSKSLKSIGNEAFSGCVGVKNITVQGTTPASVSNKSNIIPRSVKKSTILHVPPGTKETYKNASFWRDFDNVVEK